MSTMYANVHSGIIHNSQEVEMTHMSMVHEWINKVQYILAMRHHKK